MQRLREEGEEGMIHSLLSSLPDLYDDYESDEPASPIEASVEVAGEASTKSAQEKDLVIETLDAASSPECNDDGPNDVLFSEIESVTDISSHSDDTTLMDESSNIGDAETDFPSTLEDDPTLVSGPTEKTSHHLQEPSTETVGSFHTVPEVADPEEPAQVDEKAPEPVAEGTRRPRIHISTLLERADELFNRHHLSIDLPSIMGPQSVMRTWTENPALLPTDDEAEIIVTRPHQVVLPPPPEDDEEQAEKIEEDSVQHKRKRVRRRLRKPTRIASMVVERKAVVASAVLVLGVAMAVYGFQVAPEPHHSHAAARELRRFSKYFGGIVIGAGTRLWEGVVAMAQV